MARNGQLEESRFMHFATHASMDSRQPLWSALVLSPDEDLLSAEAALTRMQIFDGLLTASAILDGWGLQAELVVLSACETPLGQHARGEGYLGFSQALFVAGADSIIVSLWRLGQAGLAFSRHS